MTTLSENIKALHPVRKTKAQKTAFISLLQEEFPEMTVEQGGPLKSRNLIVGDVRTAKAVITAHYDTCSELPFPNLIMPKNFILTVLYALLLALPLLAVSAGVEILLRALTDSFWIAYWGAMAVFLSLYFFVFLAGKANPSNVNDNTSGVVLLCELIRACREKGVDDVAFVFFDHEESGLFGSAFFRSRYKKEMRDKLLINFDCVSDGDHLLFVLSKAAQERYGQLIAGAFTDTEKKTVCVERSSHTFYPSDQMGFHTGIGVSAMKKKKRILYLDRIHTRKDTAWDEENLAYLTSGTVRFLETMTAADQTSEK